MNDFNMIQLAVGAFGCMVLAVSGAFVLYWQLIAKKHLVTPQQKQRKVTLTVGPVFELRSARLQHN
ncbi:MAG: hypothetical protein ACOYL3_05015 [Desulfuromonadaceae bacterium]